MVLQFTRCIAVVLSLGILVKTGTGIQLDLAIPKSGSVIADFANNSLNFHFFCRLRNNDNTQIASNWFILSASRAANNLSPTSILPNNQQFTQSGDDIVTQFGNFTSNTNLTINGFTTNLHDSTLSCGTANDDSVAVFPILVYENPSIPRNFEVALDGLSASLTWDPPSDLGSPELSHYSLVVVDDDGAVISNESVPAPGSTVTGLLPLTHYTIQLTAISQLSPVPVTSPTIEQEITTSTSVPLVNCIATSITADQMSVRVSWDNIHTGGLNLTNTTIEYAPLNSNGSTGSFVPAVSPAIDMAGGEGILRLLPTAGLNYVFRVSTENSEGESEPSLCPAIFLEIGVNGQNSEGMCQGGKPGTGTPSTPETPLVEVDGPLAILSLRTSNSGTGDLVIPFSFNVLFYVLNSTDDRFEFSREEERFTSSDYTNNQNVLVHIEDVMELNQRYRFAARAVNKFGASAISSLSDPVLLNYSVPNVETVDLQVLEDGILVSWYFLHTGGADIELVEILIKEDTLGSLFELVSGGSLTALENSTFLIGGSSLQAGQSYQVTVRATNEFGVSIPTLSEILESTVGVPTVPLAPTLFSLNSSTITLTLITDNTGLLDETDTVTFRLRITATDPEGISETTFESGEYPGGISGESVKMTVPGVDGVSYIFSVRAENRFGPSDYSRDSESISLRTEDGDGDTSGLSMQEIIGVAVGVAVLTVLLLLCCILIICSVITQGSKRDKPVPEEGVDNRGVELQEKRHGKGSRSWEAGEEFPPEAYESQYEPPPGEEGVPLRPKPTHPTKPQQQQNQPLYDSLVPSGRQSFTVSIGSSKELPNPLYSGLAASSRPASQAQDSGSGTVHNTGRGKEEEPLYSEANMPPANDGVYTQPDEHTTRASQLLAGTSPPLPEPRGTPTDPPMATPPPPPPDPRTIPTTTPPPAHPPSPLQPDEPGDPNNAPLYTEPNMMVGSQEHLYTELPNPQPNGSHSPSHTPVFHKPPPPITPPPPSSSRESLGDPTSPP